MSTYQYQRNYRLTIYKKIEGSEKEALTTIEDLRMAFKFSRSTDSMDNKGVIRIFNLSEETRSGLSSKVNKDGVPETSVKLEVGYGTQLITVVEGTCLIYSKFAAPNSVTTIEVSDGGFEQAKKRYKKSWKKGSTYESIIKDLVAATPDLGIGNIDPIRGTLPEDRTFEGLPKTLLDGLGDDLGFRYIVENQMQRIDETADLLKAPQRYVVSFTKNSGLLQNPYHKGEHLIMEALINPVIRINTYVNLSTYEATGDFRVVGMSMKGDTHGNQWTMVVTLSTDDVYQNFKQINDTVSSGGGMFA